MLSKPGKLLALAALCIFGLFSVLGHWLYKQYFSPNKIGFSAGLSGANSELGVNGRNGVLLAIEAINSRGGVDGRKLELIVADDQNTPEGARDADHQLASQGVKVVIGHMISGVAETAVEYANANQLLLLSPTIATDTLTGMDDYFIRTIPSNRVQGKSLAQAVLQHSEARRLAIVYDRRNESFAQPIIEAFTATLESNGGKVLLFEGFTRQSEFKIIADKLKSQEADGIVLIAAGLDAGMFCQQARKRGVKLPLFLPMWSMTNNFIEAGGEDAQGAYLINQVDFYSTNPEYRDFHQKYKDRYGEEPTFAAVLSYDAAMVAAAGIGAAGRYTAQDIKQAILKQGEFAGIQGNIRLDRYGDMQGSYYLYRVQGSVFQKVGKL